MHFIGQIENENICFALDAYKVNVKHRNIHILPFRPSMIAVSVDESGAFSLLSSLLLRFTISASLEDDLIF